MRVILLIFLIFTATFAEAASESASSVHFTKIAQPAKLPKKYQSILSQLDRQIAGGNTDFFETAAWNADAETIAIWAPTLTLRDRPSSDKIVKTLDGDFVALKGGGIFFCKGCGFSERAPASEEDCGCSVNKGPLQKTLAELSQKTVTQSLRTCNWSLTEMIKKSYAEAKKTISSVLDGSMFRDLAKVVTGIEALVKNISTIVPKLEMLAGEIPALVDHLVCKIAQEAIPHFIVSAVTGGGSFTMAAAHIAIKIQKLEGNLGWLMEHPKARELFVRLAKKYGGNYPPHIWEAIENAGGHVPAKIQKFGSPNSLESHFQNHGLEMGYKTKEAYEAAAIKFGNREANSAFTLQKEDGRFVKYDSVTREIMVTNSKGELITYYKRDRMSDADALEYALTRINPDKYDPRVKILAVPANDSGWRNGAKVKMSDTASP